MTVVNNNEFTDKTFTEEEQQELLKKYYASIETPVSTSSKSKKDSQQAKEGFVSKLEDILDEMLPEEEIVTPTQTTSTHKVLVNRVRTIQLCVAQVLEDYPQFTVGLDGENERRKPSLLRILLAERLTLNDKFVLTNITKEVLKKELGLFGSWKGPVYISDNNPNLGQGDKLIHIGVDYEPVDLVKENSGNGSKGVRTKRG